MTTKQTAPVSKAKAPEPKTTVAPETATVESPVAAAISPALSLNGLPQGQGTKAVRQTMMLQQQRLHGNSHVLRHLIPTIHQPSRSIAPAVYPQTQTEAKGADELEPEMEAAHDSGIQLSAPPPPTETDPLSPSNVWQPAFPLTSQPSKNGYHAHPIQRTEESGADEAAPTEEQKAAALAAAQAAEAIASQAQGKGQEETGKSRDAKAKEDKGKETAQQEAADAKGKAEAKKGSETGAGGEGGPKPVGMKKGGEEAAAPAPALNGSAPTDKAPASAAEDQGFQGVIAKAKQAGAKQKAHDPADKKAKESQDAAEMPASEVKGRAEQGQAGKIEQAETPAFDAAAFKAKLMAQIEALAPKSAQEADDFKESGKLDGVKGSVQGQVSQEKEKSSQPLENETAAAPDTSSVPPKPVTPFPDADPGTAPLIPDAEKATPKAKTPAEVELPIANDAKTMDAKMAEAEITEDQLARSNEPTFTGALEAKKEAKTSAQQSPQGYRQGEEAQIKQAEGEAKATTEQNLAGMQGDKAAAVQQVLGKQGDSKGKDEQARQKVGQDIDQIYQSTKTKVEEILNGLDGTVEQVFSDGAAAAEKVFEDFVDAKMTAYKEKRYGGMLGWAKWAKDKILGMPAEVNTFYAEGRQLYLQKMDAVIDEVTAIIGKGLTSAKATVAKGKQEIQDYLSKLPEDLKEVGQQAAQDIQGKFDELEQSIDAKQNDLIDKLAQKYNENLQAIDARIDELKAANKGLVDKAMDAIGGVIKTILEIKEMLASILAKAQDAINSIIKDPIGFLGNLISAVKTGLQNFVGNIGEHLKKGLMTWLFGEVAKAGIQMPESFDLKGILSLVLQVLGITWANLRNRAVKMFGENVVAGLEKAWEVFQIIKEQGIGGLWEYIKEQLSNLKEMVIDGIKDMVITEVIKAGIQWLIGVLGGPAGAFVKAAKAIYDVIMWFVNNGRQLMSLVNAIVDSVSAIAAGNIGGAAKYVEDSLAQAIPTVIGFLASLLGLGGLSEKIKGIIQKIQEPVNKAIDWVLGKAKALVKKLGSILRGDNNKEDRAGNEKSKDIKAKVSQDLSGKLKNIDNSEKLKGILSPIYLKYRDEGLKSLYALPDKKTGNFEVIAVASAGDIVGKGSIEPPKKIYPSDLRFRAGTELKATLNGQPVPPTGIFKASKQDGHAEAQLADQVRANWGSMKRPKDNVLEVKIKRSPCPLCTSQIEVLSQELKPRPLIRLQMLSIHQDAKVIEGTEKFQQNVELFTRLRDSGIELSVWNVLKELDELGIAKENITVEQRQEIETRMAGVQRVLDALPPKVEAT